MAKAGIKVTKVTTRTKSSPKKSSSSKKGSKRCKTCGRYI